jgi:N-acetylglucosamine-6-phosphate deacetylase
MPTHTTLHAGQLWTSAGFADDQVIRIEGGHILEIASSNTSSESTRGGATVLDASDAIVIPGLVDIQVNGALGWSFQSQHRRHFDEIVSYHRQRGTTTLFPTLITDHEAPLLESLRVLGDYLEQAALPAIHLEGPFLSLEKSGAHNPDAMHQPDRDLAQRFVEAAGGRIGLFTLAPELPDALPVIEFLAQQGIVVCAGHTAATYAQMKSAMAAGLACVTHAGNASDWPHRAPGPLGFLASEPGIVGTLLAEPQLACGVILDGFHFHPALLSPLLRLKGADHVLLVSDASTIAGCSPGDYDSGGLQVTVHPEGFATSGRGGGWLAGSTITLLDAVQRAVQLAGIPLHEAVYMATLAPARLLKLDQRKGNIAPGCDADLLVLNQDLSLRQVMVRGEVIGEE